jgi:hypothetical protein
MHPIDSHPSQNQVDNQVENQVENQVVSYPKDFSLAFMYVCVYVCVYVCLHVCDIHKHICMYTHVFLYACIQYVCSMYRYIHTYL